MELIFQRPDLLTLLHRGPGWNPLGCLAGSLPEAVGLNLGGLGLAGFGLGLASTGLGARPPGLTVEVGLEGSGDGLPVGVALLGLQVAALGDQLLKDLGDGRDIEP